MLQKILILCLCVVAGIHQPVIADTSKVIATAGATTIEGAAGGGIVPWGCYQRLCQHRTMVCNGNEHFGDS